MMEEHNIDISNPGEIRRILLSDRSQIVHDFCSRFSDQVEKLCYGIAECFSLDSKFAEFEETKYQSSVVRAFTYGVTDSLFTSLHLLSIGYQVPSNHMFRQALEYLFMSILCSESEELELRTGDGDNTVKRVFFESYRKGKPYTRPNSALGHIQKNLEQFGFNKDGFDAIKANYERYHPFSHPSANSLYLRSNVEGNEIFVGPHHFERDFEIYAIELNKRLDFIGIFKTVVDYNANRLRRNT